MPSDHSLRNLFPNLPNGRPFLESLHINSERLAVATRVALPVAALRALLSLAVSSFPFDPEFYRTLYPDVGMAQAAGDIGDLHEHFITQGFFEGRLATRPNVDELFYRKMYPDVDAAIDRGDLSSAVEHFIRAGALEGRFASEADMVAWTNWTSFVGPG